MKRIITALAGGAAVATLAFASASVLQVDGGTIQAGSAGVTCDSDGVKVNYGLETDTNSVNSVRIEGIDSACEGAEMFVAINGDRVGAVTLTAAASQSVAITSRTPESINNVKIWIEG